MQGLSQYKHSLRPLIYPETCVYSGVLVPAVAPYARLIVRKKLGYVREKTFLCPSPRSLRLSDCHQFGSLGQRHRPYVRSSHSLVRTTTFVYRLEIEDSTLLVKKKYSYDN